MKLLFVANKLWDVYIFRGGVIKRLVEDGHEVTILAPVDGRVDVEKELGAKVIDIKVDKRGVNPVKDLELMLTLTKLYKELKPDLIFHYTIKLNIFGTLASKIAGRNSIAVATGLGYSFVNTGLISKIAKLLYKISLKFAKEVWVLNGDDKEILIEEGITDKEKIFILPGEGIDTNLFKPLKKEREDDKKVFLMISRAIFDKGVAEYAKVAELAKEKYGNKVEFQFLGAVAEDKKDGFIKEDMDELVKNNIINYLGITNDVPSIVKEADCIVLPSYREGISRVLLEAASMEKVAIATNVTGCKEIIEKNKTGFLVEAGSVESLLAGVDEFMELTPEEAVEFGKSAREKVIKEFEERIVLEIYREKVKKYGA